MQDASFVKSNDMALGVCVVVFLYRVVLRICRGDPQKFFRDAKGRYCFGLLLTGLI